VWNVYHDVLAEHFPTFAVVNPSLLASLQMMPGTAAKKAHARSH
jgi:hypothetical protein